MDVFVHKPVVAELLESEIFHAPDQGCVPMRELNGGEASLLPAEKREKKENGRLPCYKYNAGDDWFSERAANVVVGKDTQLNTISI